MVLFESVLWVLKTSILGAHMARFHDVFCLGLKEIVAPPEF